MASYRPFFGDMLCRHFLKRRCAVYAQTLERAGGGHRHRESLVAARGARPKLQCVEYRRSHRARDTSLLTACGREHDSGSGFSGERVIVQIGEVRRFIPAFLPVSRAAALSDALPGPSRKLVRQRTEIVNALRAALYEFGHIVPQGIHHVARIREILHAPNSDLPALMRDERLAMLDHITALNRWIDAKTAGIKEQAAATPVSQRLQTMPGVGPLIAMAVETFAPAMTSFRSGRDFAAWLGLVP